MTILPKRSAQIFVLTLIAIVTASCGDCGYSKDSELKLSITDRLSLLVPTSAQSIVVAKGPFNLQSLPSVDPFTLFKQVYDRTGATPTQLQIARGFCSLTGNIQMVSNGSIYESLAKHKIFSAAKVVFEFQPNRYMKKLSRDWEERGCNVVLFESSPSDHKSMLSLLESECTSKYIDSGFTVFACETSSPTASWGIPESKEAKTARKAKEANDEAKLRRIETEYIQYLKTQGKVAEAVELATSLKSIRDSTVIASPILVSIPAPGLMLTADGDSESMHKVLECTRQTDVGSQNLHELPEWKLVDKSAEVYGIRHFPPVLKNDDPTNPRQKPTFDTMCRKQSEVLDRDAIGFVMNLSDTSLTYSYLSKSKDLKKTFIEMFPKGTVGGDISTEGAISTAEDQIKITLKPNTALSKRSFNSALFWLGNRWLSD